MRRRAVLLFIKQPIPGRVKTRLARTVGEAEATKVYRQLVDAVIRNLPHDATILVTYDPPEEEGAIREWLETKLPVTRRYLAQSAGGLGDRLVAAFDAAFSMGFDEVAVIGTDCPFIDRAIWDEAWLKLAQADVVIGPSLDGGYYLLALKRRTPGLFEEVPWSSEHVCSVTLRQATELGLEVAQLPPRIDVDDEEAWVAAKEQMTKNEG